MSDRQFKIYTASAGSGKTYTIVREFLTLSLSRPIVSCKDILAVTFTNKAANEMKVKILNNLAGIINDDEKCENMKAYLVETINIDEKTLKERAANLYDVILHNYSDFSISTIDSFVQQISRSFSRELNLPAQYKVLIDDDELLDGLIQKIDEQIVDDNKSLTEILTDFVNFQLEEENSWRVDVPLREYVNKLLKENAYKRGEIFNVKSLEDVEYQEMKQKLNEINAKCKEIVLSDIKRIGDFEVQYGIDTDSYNAKSNGLSSIVRKIKKDMSVAPSNIMTKTVKTIINRSGDADWYNSKINKMVLEKVDASGIDVVGLYQKLIDDQQDYFIVSLIRRNLYLYALRRTLLSVINQYIEETNKVHISEFNKRISDIIRDCSAPFIYERIGVRYKHFFIDEFQDTSILQWQNFLPLVHNSLSEGKMNLLVGDAKQAIYRFRSGEVEQIIKLPYIHGLENNPFKEECENTFKENHDPCLLKSNYRSKKNIIDFNNSFFKLSKIKLSENYGCVYDDVRQECPKNHDYEGFVSVELFDMSKFENDENPKKSYKEAVIQSILNDINSLKEKGFKYKDITILVRNNTDGSKIAEYLSDNGVPVVSSDSILLKSSDKVRLIILTLKYLLDDKNNITRLSLSFYKNICTEPHECDIQHALEDTFDRDRIYDVRNQSYSMYDLCAGIIKMYGFSVIEDEYLQYFMNMIHDWQNMENGGLDAFIEYWEKKSDTFFVKTVGNIDAVQIMTIHKSKGLEFKVVMYPYAYVKVPEKMRGGEKWIPSSELEMLKEVPHIDDFILPINKELIETKMEKHYVEEEEKSAFDDFNIMYVAMTRPSDLLFIYTKIEGDDEDNFFKDYFSQKNVSDEDLKLVERFVDTEKEKSVAYILGEICAFEDGDKEVSIDLELEEGDVNATKTLDWTNSLSMESDPTMFWADDRNEYLPQEWGILVHEILSKINTIDDVDKVLDMYLNEGSIDQNQLEKLHRLFDDIINKPEIKAAYSKDAIVRNEMEILIASQKNIKRPDRFAELQNKVILIDYKTGKHNDTYEDDMRMYVTALQDMGVDKTIEAYLVYLGEDIKIEPVFFDRLF